MRDSTKELFGAIRAGQRTLSYKRQRTNANDAACVLYHDRGCDRASAHPAC